MECDTLCICCKRLDEDGSHLFLKCGEMKEIWKKLNLIQLRDRMGTLDTAQDVVQEILSLNDEKKVLILCLLSRWWDRRNKQNKEGKKLSDEEVLRQARYWTAESL